MDMTPSRWEATFRYLEDVFGREDGHLKGLSVAANRLGLPDISVGPVVGRLLMILASMLPEQSARTSSRDKLALEVGTLGGYSAVWIARGLGPNGRLITIEIDPKHADFAQEQFQMVGLADRIDLRRGDARTVLPEVASEIGEGALNMLFLDAEKVEYPEYWRLTRPLIAPGGIVVIDNALGSGSWWIDDVGHPSRDAADAVNKAIASDPDYEAVAFPLRQGVLIARRMK